MKRTRQGEIENLEDVQDLDQLVVDKRSGKRATSAKGRRRNRRYENRLLSAQVDAQVDVQLEEIVDEPVDGQICSDRDFIE
jgi:hypothetical protein